MREAKIRRKKEKAAWADMMRHVGWDDAHIQQYSRDCTNNHTM